MARKTKRVSLGFLGVLGSIFASVAFGQSTGNHEGFLYYDDGTEITITGQTLAWNDTILIPETIRGKPVSAIGPEAFRGARKFFNVAVPKTIRSIGDRAFQDCLDLNMVQFLGSPPTMGIDAFANTSPFFKVFFLVGGFTVPSWEGHQSHRGVMGGFNRGPLGKKLWRNFFYLDHGTAVTITGTNSLSIGELIIPTEIEGKPVVNIGLSAFAYSQFTSISIPETVKFIDRGAFNGAWRVLYLRIPDSVTELGSGAFSSMSNLISLYIGSGLTSIPDEAFSHCESLRRVHLGDSVEHIGALAFKGALSLEGVRIPASVTSLGFRAFGQSPSLEAAQFLGSAPNMEQRVFENTPPEFKIYYSGGGFTSPMWLGYPAVAGLPPNPILVHDPNEPLNKPEDSLRFQAWHDQVVVVGYDWQNPPVGKLVIPSRILGKPVTTIDHDAFRGANLMTELIIPKSVRRIGSFAFRDCSGLTEVSILGSSPEGTEIEYGAFDFCSALKSVNLGEGVVSIQSGAFANCPELTTVSLPSSLKLIDDFAFVRAGQLTSVVIPSGVARIGWQAFAECPSLERLTIEAGENREMVIGAEAFARLPALTSITLGEGVKVIGERAFESCPLLTSVVIPAGVGLIGERAFAELTGLTSLTLNSGLKEIGARAFANCPLLTSVEIPSNTAKIGEGAFAGCAGLTSVTIRGGADGRLEIEQAAFAELKNLSTLLLGSGIQTIGHRAFSGCSNLTSVVIPASVKTIGSHAFEECAKLAHVSILGDGEVDRVIDTRTFFRLPMLETVELGEGIREISWAAFAECPKLTSIRLPNSLRNLGPGAFLECKSLATVDFGTGVEMIGNLAFGGCEALAEVDLPASLRGIGDLAFFGTTSLAKLTLREGLEWIGWEAFAGSKPLRSLRLPNSLVAIGPSAFAGSVSLESVTFGTKLSKIGANAFASCSQLRAAFFAGNAPTLEEDVFLGVHPTFTVHTWNYRLFGPEWSGLRLLSGGLPTSNTLRVLGVEGGELSPSLEGLELNIGQRYTVTAPLKAGWVFVGWKRPGQPIFLGRKLTFTMEEWMTLEPIYVQNRLPEMAGFYNGLLLSAEEVATGEEFFAGTGWITLAVNAKGGFTGTVLHGGQRMAVRGAFGLEGKFRVMLKLRGQSYGELALAMDFATGEMTGEFGEGLVLRAVRNGYSRKMPHPMAGERYQTSLQRESEGLPVNSGEVSLAIAFDGKTRVTGRLADGSVLIGVFGLGPGLTETSIENPSEQPWTLPVFFPLYQGAVGLLAGEAEISGEPGAVLTGEMGWFCSEGARLSRSRQGLAGHFSSLSFGGGN